jgi:putative ABC transport system substrate-binding protein
MKRRDFIALAGSATAWSLSAAAQPSNSNLTVGVLIGGPEDAEGQKRVTAFRQELKARGWVEGVNTRVVVRWAAGNVERIRMYSAELAVASPDVLLGSSTPVVAILRQEAGRTPIVFVSVSDPVGSGFINSFHQPGGNSLALQVSSIRWAASGSNCSRGFSPPW